MCFPAVWLYGFKSQSYKTAPRLHIAQHDSVSNCCSAALHVHAFRRKSDSSVQCVKQGETLLWYRPSVGVGEAAVQVGSGSLKYRQRGRAVVLVLHCCMATRKGG